MQIKILFSHINKSCAFMLALMTAVLAIFVNQILCFSASNGNLHLENSLHANLQTYSFQDRSAGSNDLNQTKHALRTFGEKLCRDLVLDFRAGSEIKREQKLATAYVYARLFVGGLLPWHSFYQYLPAIPVKEFFDRQIIIAHSAFKPLHIRLLI